MSLSRETLQRMTACIAHRGPDDDGLYMTEDRRVGLGFRRLSILDLSYAGHQPMSTAGGEIWITFNGEIYNHGEIRADLEKKGYEYRSHSDTETLLYAYQEYGLDFIDRLIGMFAIAIWDARSGSVHLIRDRLGIKPLYVTEKEGSFLWGSEIKSLLQHPGVTPELNVQGLSDYLSFYVTPPGESMFRGIHKLEAGHVMTIDPSGSTNVRKFWDVDHVTREYSRQDLLNEEFCVEEIRTLLRDSIRLRMISDVPFGVLLSGGVDSSLNVALMSELMDRPVDTFTAGFADLEEHNELEYARLVSDRFSTNHHETLINESSVVDNLSRMVHHQDEPNADPACVPMFFVAHAARQAGTIVVQVGEGADETFSGYSHYLSELRYHRYYYRLPRLVHTLLHPILTAASKSEVLHDYAERARTRSTPVFYGAVPAFSEGVKQRILRADLSSELASAERISREYLARFDRLWEGRPSSHLRRMTYFDMKVRLSELLLMRVDKMTMAHSIEARVPFLDHRIVEFAFQVPDSLKVRGKIGKYVLKKAAEGIIPNEVIYRRKQGLNSPIVEWLRSGRLSQYARETILDAPILQSERGIFDRSVVEELLRQHSSGDQNRAKSIWALLILALWEAEHFS